MIFSPGGGFLLFGDKTGLAIASAFDRINVRRLFLNLEQELKLLQELNSLSLTMRLQDQTSVILLNHSFVEFKRREVLQTS